MFLYDALLLLLFSVAELMLVWQYADPTKSSFHFTTLSSLSITETNGVNKMNPKPFILRAPLTPICVNSVLQRVDP